MRDYTRIVVPENLLPQIVGEILEFAADPNLVEVVHETHGRVVHAHPAVANAWYQARQDAEEKKKAEEKPAEPSEPKAAEPARPAAPAPRKRTTASA